MQAALLLLAFVAAALAGPFRLGPFDSGPISTRTGAALVGQSLGPAVPATSDDPSSILTSVTSSGAHLVITLEDPSTVSDTPDEMALWSVPLRDAFGALHDLDPRDGAVLRLWLGDNGMPADVICSLTVTDGAMSGTTKGVGVTLQAGTSGATITGQTIGNGTSWANTAAAAGSLSTYGAELHLAYTTSATGQLGYRVHPLDALGASFLLTSGSPAAGSTNSVVGPWDTLNVGCGWRTGSGGTAGAVVVVGADVAIVPAARVASTARSARQQSSRIPLLNGGAIPSALTILAGINSHWQGAASGPVDTQFAGLELLEGCTYRQNNGGSVTDVTTWGDRQGEAPHLCEKMLAAGVTTVDLASNAGSGRSAAVMLTNIGAAARDTYALGTATAPVQVDAIVWMGIPIGALADQAGYDAFIDPDTGFPALLDAAAAQFPGVPIFVHIGISDDELDSGPYWDDTGAAIVSICATKPNCRSFGSALPRAKIDGTDHPTVGPGEGTDDLADQVMDALGFP